MELSLSSFIPYITQQGIAVVVCLLVAGLFARATLALFKMAREDAAKHEAALELARQAGAAGVDAAHAAAAVAYTAAAKEWREERAQDRTEFLAQLTEQRRALDANTAAMAANTHAIDALSARLTSPIGGGGGLPGGLVCVV